MIALSVCSILRLPERPGATSAPHHSTRDHNHGTSGLFPKPNRIDNVGPERAAECRRTDESGVTVSKIYVIHENSEWVEPLRAAFAALDLPYEEWFLSEGLLNLADAPPEGVFYNRMSASSHTRGHRYAAEYTGGVLAWLESHRRRVINNGRALQLEVSKIAQYAALANYGIRTPRTLAAVGRANLVAAARQMAGPFITKHNRAGKGLGVRLFNSVEAFEKHVDSEAF